MQPQRGVEVGWKWAEQGVWKERKALRGAEEKQVRIAASIPAQNSSFFVAGGEAESEMPVTQIRLCSCFLSYIYLSFSEL